MVLAPGSDATGTVQAVRTGGSVGIYGHADVGHAEADEPKTWRTTHMSSTISRPPPCGHGRTVHGTSCGGGPPDSQAAGHG